MVNIKTSIRFKTQLDCGHYVLFDMPSQKGEFITCCKCGHGSTIVHMEKVHPDGLFR